MTDAGTDAGKSCRRDFSQQDCASNEYCKVANCADKGTCTKKPDVNTAQGDVVCGCDGVSYYSPELAASFGVSVNPAFANECTGGARKTCSGISACPAGRYCAYAAEASNGICSITTSGACWGLPNNCPTLPPNPAASANVAKNCTTGECTTFCEAIKNEEPWFGTTYNKCN